MSKKEDKIFDENGFEVLPNEPQMSAKTGKRRRGQPKVLTDAKVRRICDFIRKGNFVKQSCQAAGVSYNTFLSGMKMGKKMIRPYNKWFEEVELAKAEAETDLVEVIHDQIEMGNVGVAQWMLARKYPQRWEKTEKIKAKVDNSQRIEIVRHSDVHGKEE